MPLSLTNELVAAAVGGDRAARDALASGITEQVRVMVAARLRPGPERHEAVDDLAQQCILGLWEGIGRLDAMSVEGMKAYLSGIVSRKVADHARGAARSRARRGGGGLGSPGAWASSEAFTSALIASGMTPSSIVGRAEQARRVLQAMDHLKPEHRQAITLAFFDQLPTARIADLMGISRPAASMLVLRAVRALGRGLSVQQESAVPDATERAN